MKYYFFTTLSILLFISGHAQNYTPFDTTSFSKRKLFIEEFSNRHKLKIKEIKKAYSGNTSKEIQESYTNQFEYIKRKIDKKELYFDDKIQSYIDKIVTEIISNNPVLADKKIQAYFSRNSEPNAFSIGDGTIIFNLELLKYLNDEAEIGFVLSHEIAHYVLNHRDTSIQKSIIAQNSDENKKAEKEIRKSKYNKQTKSDALVKKYVYDGKYKSRYHEFQADSLGLVFYKNTNYNSASSIDLLKHLSKTDTERDSLSRKSYVKNFTTKNQPFLKDWIVMEDFSKYNYSKDHIFNWNIDSLKTHPNCDERIERISSKIGTKKKDFYTDKIFFTDLKKRIEYEQIYNDYYIENYGESLYNCLKQKEKDPKNIFLNKIIAANLEALAKAKKEMRINTYIPSINPKAHTKSQQYYFGFMSNLTLSELTQLATDYKNL